MSEVTIAEFFAVLDSGGTLAVLVVAIIAWFRGWIISRGEHDRALEREEQWRQMALDATGLAERAVSVAEPTGPTRPRRQRP